MQEFTSIDDVLNFASSEEENAVNFYKELAAKMERPEMKKVFEGFAEEEERHKEKLLSIVNDQAMPVLEGGVENLKIAEYVVDVDLDSDALDYQQALILAMKKEKAAFKLYSDLAHNAEDPDYRNLFLALAQEEARHKLRFEVEYDEQFLTEN